MEFMDCEFELKNSEIVKISEDFMSNLSRELCNADGNYSLIEIKITSDQYGQRAQL